MSAPTKPRAASSAPAPKVSPNGGPSDAGLPGQLSGFTGVRRVPEPVLILAAGLVGLLLPR